MDKVPYWEKFFNSPLFIAPNLMLGGDLNFTIGDTEIWGTHAHRDPFTYYFLSKLEDLSFFGIVPVKIIPTWWNMRVF